MRRLIREPDAFPLVFDDTEVFRDHQKLAAATKDALAAFNAGPEAVRDLEATLAEILSCFRIGRRTWFSSLVRPRVERILFAATKADHLHHTSHDRLEHILARMTRHAIAQAKFTGALIEVAALASVRATREAIVEHGGEAQASRDAFASLSPEDQTDLHIFLLSLTREPKARVAR